MDRFNEIKRLIALEKSDREISRTLQVRRNTVAEIRKQILNFDDLKKVPNQSPLWLDQILNSDMLQEIKDGFEFKRIWELRAKDHSSYSNFCKQLQKKVPDLIKATVTLREFNPGEYAEVDFAGDKIEWIDEQGEIHEASIFVGVLCFSQLIFAVACENEKSSQWLLAHRRMYEFFGGVPKVTVCDCLKAGVAKAHRYDPDLNPSYRDLAEHYQTAVVPARVRHPKDKALVEGAVKIVSRYFNWVSRKRTFTSIREINQELEKVVKTINQRPHTRFKIARVDRFEKLEKELLKDLPIYPFQEITWKKALVHPDCTVTFEHNYYSVPHQRRGEEVMIKSSAHQVEIFLNLDRLALHSKIPASVGRRFIQDDHLPANSLAYKEMVPQKLLSQSKFIHKELNLLLQDLFEMNTLANLRRAQGLIRVCQMEIKRIGDHKESDLILIEAFSSMRRFNNYRVQFLETEIRRIRKQTSQKADREIKRMGDNPHIRYQAGQGLD